MDPTPNPWLTPTDEYTRPVKVKDAEGDEREGSVTLRLLDAGVKAEIEDSVQMAVDQEEGTASGSARIGTMKQLTVQRAVVTWDLPGVPPPTEALIRRLKPEVFEQIFALCSFGSLPPEPKPEPEESPTQPPSGDVATEQQREPVTAV